MTDNVDETGDQGATVTVKSAPKPPAKKPAPPAAKKPAPKSIAATVPYAPPELEKMDEVDQFIWQSIFHIVKDSPYALEAQAVARLSLMGNVCKLIKDNTDLASSIASICEKFNVSVKSTMIADNAVYEVDKPILRDGKYDTNMLQQGLISLVARFSGLSRDKQQAENLLKDEQSRTNKLTEDNRRLLNEVAVARAVPLPDQVAAPYVLSRNVVKKDGVKQIFICKDEATGYTTTASLSKAQRFSDVNKIASHFAYLCDHQNDYPIKHVHLFGITSLHYIPFSISKLNPELQLKVAPAIERARLNDT